MSGPEAATVRYPHRIGHPAERLDALDPASSALARSAAGLSPDALAYIAASKAPATLRAYRADLRDFEAWCEGEGRRALPADPESVASYLAWLARSGRTWATVSRRMSAVSQAHRLAGLPSPTRTDLVRMTAAGVRRSIGAAPRRARPVLAGEVAAMAAASPPGLRGLRDRALLLVGFGGGFRRSELAALDVGDVAFAEGGLRVLVRRSKTDQGGEGREVGIACAGPLEGAAGALEAWLEGAGIASGPLFRGVTAAGRVGPRISDRAVARAVKRAAARVGIDPATVSGHSLRSGLATSAAAAGAPERAIMRTTGHRSEAVVRVYIREAGVLADSASRWLGGDDGG